MRAVLDTCVLYPTVMRQILVKVAASGGFEPLWSDEILSEWRRAVAKDGGDVGVDIALLNDRWPDACIGVDIEKVEELSLPDRHDRHVLAAAIAGNADIILTKNLQDFPTRVLARHGILRREPDGFLLEIMQDGAVDVAAVIQDVQSQIEAASGQDWPVNTLLKKAGLPRLGKHLSGR